MHPRVLLAVSATAKLTSVHVRAGECCLHTHTHTKAKLALRGPDDSSSTCDWAGEIDSIMVRGLVVLGTWGTADLIWTIP
jgi:hypothetical protein